jgi:HKD family nuclease
MRYLDTGSRDPDHSLYRWLERTLRGARYFASQIGYFSADGIYPLEQRLLDLLAASGELHLVVGANEDGLRSDDLTYVLDLFDQASPDAATSLVVVAADDVLMHPKTYYIERADGHRSALVGSVNLTHSGLARNLEAALTVDSDDDPAAPLDQIRDAILAWQSPARTNAFPIDRDAIKTLVADGVLDAPRPPRPTASKGTRKKRRKYFPPLGPLLKLPRRRRPVAPKAPVTRPTIPLPAPIGTLATMPPGAVGVIKRLSNLDVKAFRGERGTAYMALPKPLADFLPLAPAGNNNEPRVNVTIEARLESAPNQVFTSGDAPTNITHVGMGTPKKSHTDLRLNYLTVIKGGIQYIADNAQVSVPKAGDLAAVEFVEGVRVRVTFISDPSSINNLTPLLDQRANGWGWLPPDIIGPWNSGDEG